MKKYCSLFLAAALAAGSAVADDNGGRPGAFLDYSASARSLGMGQAFTGIADDPSALYWNPAGLPLMKQKALAAQYSALAEQSSFGFLGYTNPLERGGLGVGLVNLQSGKISRRDDTGRKTGEYDAASSAALLSGAIAANPLLSLGGTVKFVRQRVDGKSAVGFGLDVSGLYRLSQRLQFGLMIRNLVAPSLTLNKEADKYPRSVAVGAGYRPARPIILGLDLEQSSGDSVRPRLGVEYLINNTLSLRTGVNDAEFAVGLGIGFAGWNFDYAMGLARASSEIRDLGSFQRFGFRYNFGSRVNAAAAAAPPAQKVTLAAPAVGAPAETGESALEGLGKKLDDWDGIPTPEIQKQVNVVSRNLRRGLYVTPEELYAAQGYISYFTGEYLRSASSLEQALAAAPDDEKIARRLEKARAAAEKVKKKPAPAVRSESAELRSVRERFDSGDHAAAVVAAQRVLERQPQNAEAAEYLRKSIDRLKQPYVKQAKDLLDADRFLESFVVFQKVLDYDPDDADSKAYAARVAQIIEKKSDLDASTRMVNRDDSGLKQGLGLYQKGLRLYGHGDMSGAAEAWGNALPYLKSSPVVYDSVRAAIAELGQPAPY